MEHVGARLAGEALHAIQLRDRADVLDKRAAHAPYPVAERLRANANKLRDHADAHGRTRLTLKDATIARLKVTIANKNTELDQLRVDVPALVRTINVLTLEN